MQDLVVDKLASKHIPIASRIAALPHLAAPERARPLAGENHPTATAARPQPTVARPIAAATPTLTRTYSGSMTLGGTLSDTNHDTGTWSGILHETLIVTVDANGNGTGFETLSGSLGLTVKNSNGDTKSVPASSFGFTLPYFTITRGHFSINQSGGDFAGLLLTLKVNGTLNTAQPTASESLNIPFSGFVGSALVSGSINGSSSLKTPALALSGAVAGQSAYAGTKTTPFKNLTFSDLNGVPVTATVIMSNATHGTLTNLSGGKYNRATGTYTITGNSATVNHALNVLEFDPNGKLVTSATAFAIRLNDSKGGALTNRTTSVRAINPLSIKGVFANQGVNAAKTIPLFHTVTIGDLLGSETDFVKIALSKPANGTLTNLGGGLYNKKTGVYTFKGTAAAATNAIRGLVFDPSGAAGQSTGFTITVLNPGGALVTNARATVVTKITTPATTVALFGQYVAAGLHVAADHAAGIAAPHDLPASTHLQLAASHG